jgi:CBS-domain-containing membrane protein
MTQIVEVMTRELVAVSPGTVVADAERLASERGIRHLLVVARRERLVGVVCVCDLRRAPAGARVRGYMAARPHCVDGSTRLEEAAEILGRRAIGCLPVVAGRRVVGIVTGRDVERAGLPRHRWSSRICASCGGHHDVRSDPRAGPVWFCLDCLDRSLPPDDLDELGEGD